MFCNLSSVHSPFILSKLSRSVVFYIKTKARQSVSGTQFTVRYLQFKSELHSRTQFAIQKFIFRIWGHLVVKHHYVVISSFLDLGPKKSTVFIKT